MNLLILVLGAAVVYVLQALLCRLLWRRSLRASAGFSQGEAAQGDTVELVAMVENGKMLPLPTVKADLAVDRGLVFLDQANLAVSDQNYRSEIFALRGYERVERRIPVYCARRGFYSVGQMDLVGNDLFYTQRFVHRQAVDSGSLYVCPGSLDSRQLLAATQKLLGDWEVPRSDCDDPFTFRGIRQYEPFDSMRDINWKATAKTGQLRVNVRAYTADQEICILLDTQWDALLKPEELLEESVRIASSMAGELIGAGVTTAIRSNGKDYLTGEIVSIAGGGDWRHFETIRRSLARLVIPRDREADTFAGLLLRQLEEMKAAPNRKMSIVMISTQTGAEIRRLWRELHQQSVRAYWILPAYSRADVARELAEEPDALYWEVPRGK